MNNDQEEKRYTSEEIKEMFRNDETLPKDFRQEVLARLDATYQAMHDCVHFREERMHVADPYSDRWINEYNRFVTLYQHYKSHPKHYVTMELEELHRKGELNWKD
mgnify:CR=1 FL=1